MQYLLTIITNEKIELDLERKIGKRVQSSMEQTQKEYYLPDQLKAIKKELGESDGKLSEVDQLREDIMKAEIPERITNVAIKEISRFERIPQSSGESAVMRNYLEWL